MRSPGRRLQRPDALARSRAPPRVLGAVGIEAEASQVSKLLSELEGKNLEEVLAEGRKKLSSVPSGGGAVSAAPAGGAAPAAAAAAPKKEEKKEPTEEEVRAAHRTAAARWGACACMGACTHGAHHGAGGVRRAQGGGACCGLLLVPECWPCAARHKTHARAGSGEQAHTHMQHHTCAGCMRGACAGCMRGDMLHTCVLCAPPSLHPCTRYCYTHNCACVITGSFRALGRLADRTPCWRACSSPATWARGMGCKFAAACRGYEPVAAFDANGLDLSMKKLVVPKGGWYPLAARQLASRTVHVASWRH